ARYPHLALLDYTHSEVEDWKNGGYPGMSVRLGRQLDLHVTNTQHLKRWMVARGADPAHIQVCYCGVGTTTWSRDSYNVGALRTGLQVSRDMPLILYVGRLSHEKRPLEFVKIVDRLRTKNSEFMAVMIGDGEERGAVERYIRANKLEKHVHLL